MPRFLFSAAPLLFGCLFGSAASHAQAQSNAYMYVGANSQVTMTGFGAATLSSTGATATGLYSFINADFSTTNYEGLSTFSSSQLTVTGGTFQQLVADDTSTINLVGSNLAESKSFYFDPAGDSFYTLTGTLQGNSSPFTAGFYRPSTGTLEFNGVPAVPGSGPSNPVPEASTTISFGVLLLLGFGVLTFKRRKAAASSS